MVPQIATTLSLTGPMTCLAPLTLTAVPPESWRAGTDNASLNLKKCTITTTITSQPPCIFPRSCTSNSFDAPGSLRRCRLRNRRVGCISASARHISHCHTQSHRGSIHCLHLVLVEMNFFLLLFGIGTSFLLMNVYFCHEFFPENLD